MIAIKSLLSHLSREDVSEVVLQSGRPPSMRVGVALEDAGTRPMSSDDIVQVLFSAGGSRYVEALGAKPTLWRTRVEGVGPVQVCATQREDVIEARFSLRDSPAKPVEAPARAAPTPVRAPMWARHREEVPVSPPAQREPPAPDDVGPTTPRRIPSRSETADFATPPALAPTTPRRIPSRSETTDFATPRAPAPVDHPLALPTPPRAPDSDQDVVTLSARRGPQGEREIEIRPSAIPSVPQEDLAPQPNLDDIGFGPPSPRTLPEARFSRGADAPRPTHSRIPVITMVDGSQESAASSPATPTPGEIGELTEPFTLSPRSEAAGLLEARATRTGTKRITTRPFARDPHTGVFREQLHLAREAGASDLHIMAGRPMLLRIAGQVVARGEPIDPRVAEDMLHARVPSRLMETLDQEGSCCFAHQEPELGRFRVNVTRQRSGLKASLRLIALEVPTLVGLGLPDTVAAATLHRQGLIIVAGPAGHGKTTTLAALVDVINRASTRHVLTIEDPIEHLHERRRALLSQREIGVHARSFAAALDASLRQDPDVIVLGELPDVDTVRRALAACEAGHLVLGAMNAPSAVKAIDRVLDMFPPEEHAHARASLAGELRLVVSQRLLPDPDGKRTLAAFEVLPGLPSIRALIRDNRTYQIPSAQQGGKGHGATRLDDSLAELVRSGRVSVAAAVAVAEAPEELEAAFGAKRQAAAAAPVAPRPPDPGSPAAKKFFDRVLGTKKGA